MKRVIRKEIRTEQEWNGGTSSWDDEFRQHVIDYVVPKTIWCITESEVRSGS